MSSGHPHRVRECVLGIYFGYSRRPWPRRLALLGLGFLVYALGSFIADDPGTGVICIGFAVIWFMKMMMWSFIKTGRRRPPV
ncbi:MAG: hypothetical protein V7643_5000 [Mycobacterium sp.]